MTSKSKTAKTRPAIKPTVVHKKSTTQQQPHVHKWNTFINHMTEAPEGRRCACGVQEWF